MDKKSIVNQRMSFINLPSGLCSEHLSNSHNLGDPKIDKNKTNIQTNKLQVSKECNDEIKQHVTS